MAQDYNKTIHLPKTDFPMRGNLPKRDQELFKKYDDERLYYKMIENNEGKPLYILHDGPPYANGAIHLGTTLNKVLKDFIVKQKNMSGYKAPYIPGWDTHGLPIELKALKSAGADKNTITPVELRKVCKDYALSHVENQKAQFKSLGVLGDYENPYLTLRPEFEARQIEIFGEMAKRDFIYKGLKPVYWCPECDTALAEAEIEYAEDPCYSIYVKFAVTDDKGFFEKQGIDKSKVFFVIWTTTTWTLPGNLAICLGPNYDYTLVKNGEEYYVMARELVAPAMEAAKIEGYEMIGSFAGSEFEYMKCAHPFLDRESLVIVGDHVTLESGTGCVHTAPGHGVEDFEVCKHYPEIPIVVPVDSNGVLTKEAGEFQGLKTDDANKAIAKKLEETGNLFAIQKIIHQYPHCWRCKSPIIYRATEQWFCSIDDFKEDAIKAITDVNWIPGWGEERIKGMVRDRSDWCISRQRVWGVPIPIIYCKECGKPIINDDTIHAIADTFRKEGSDAWFAKDIKEIIPEGIECPDCHCHEFRKETDIMDVWFDSGVSHASVLGDNPEMRWPADLYLEGSDQYRGWFQSSLLTAVATKGTAPYKNVCTHGWVVDGEGRKMSKSMQNGVAPEKIINQYGTDILRLWVASSDYHADVRISPEILKQLSEAYRKIRNTARFILGNISDFDPNTDKVANSSLHEIDKWALVKLDALIKKVNEAYNAFDFHIIYHAIHNYCVVDMSNFYLDIIKDRLYCGNMEDRRAAQTAMYVILDSLTRLIAPILAFTSEEIWSFLPHTEGDNTESVLLNPMPTETGIQVDEVFTEKWNKIYAIRECAKKALETKRAAKEIGGSLEANLVLHCREEDADFFTNLTETLEAVFIVSDVSVSVGGKGEFDFPEQGISIDVVKAAGEKCERCWIYSDTVGKNEEHPTLCARCAEVLAGK